MSAADQGVESSIPSRSHTFMEIDHEIISTAILLPSADYKGKYVQMEMADPTQSSLPRKKVWLGELTIPT